MKNDSASNLTKFEYAVIELAKGWRAAGPFPIQGKTDRVDYTSEQIARRAVGDARALFAELEKEVMGAL
jgi:hypothetical protein